MDFIINNNRNNMEAFANSDVPFEKIVELAKVKVVNHRNPIFDWIYFLKYVGIAKQYFINSAVNIF